MKKILIILIVISLPFSGQAQSKVSLDLEAYFSAIIVKNISNSITWYVNNLGFEVINNKEYPERGFKIANLKRENILIELIELKSAVSPEEVIPTYTNKTRLVGFFKLGFLVSDFDGWINNLTQSTVKFNGHVVTDKITGKKVVILKDPDGNRIQLFEQ